MDDKIFMLIVIICVATISLSAGMIIMNGVERDKIDFYKNQFDECKEASESSVFGNIKLDTYLFDKEFNFTLP